MEKLQSQIRELEAELAMIADAVNIEARECGVEENHEYLPPKGGTQIIATVRRIVDRLRQKISIQESIQRWSSFKPGDMK